MKRHEQARQVPLSVTFNDEVYVSRTGRLPVQGQVSQCATENRYSAQLRKPSNDSGHLGAVLRRNKEPLYSLSENLRVLGRLSSDGTLGE
jgi:hypothetical protein